MELRRYLTLLGRGWWIVLCAALMVHVALTQFTNQQPRVYSATTTLIVSPSLSLATDYEQVIGALNSLDKRSVIVTYETILSSEAARQKAIDALQLGPEQQRGLRVVGQSVVEANAVQIIVEAGDAQVAAAVANRIAEQAIADLKQLYTVYDLTLLDRAVPSSRPIRPDPAQTNLGVPLGLLLGAAIVLFLNYLRVPTPSLIPQSLPSLRAGVSNLARGWQQRLAARRNRVALILAVLPADVDAGPAGAAERLRAYLHPILRERDTVLALPDMKGVAVVLPGASRSDAERIVEQARARLSQNGSEPAIDATFSVAGFDRLNGSAHNLLRRAVGAIGMARPARHAEQTDSP